jgi:hypothetical protein
MKAPALRTRRRLAAGVLAAGLAGALVVARTVGASDHQDTPEVEFSPRFDVNDVYAFPGSAGDRVVLVLGTSSPLTPAQTATHAFGDADEELYQLKIDNTGDAVEDLVIQATFHGPVGRQTVTVRGPTRPNETGVANTLLGGAPVVSGPVGHVLGSPAGMRVFAGPRDDPFFLDLEQFFRIVPDRRPAAGPLSQLPSTPSASSFRNPGIDYLAGFNDLAIVVEVPVAWLTDGGNARFGVWGTTSRARRTHP